MRLVRGAASIITRARSFFTSWKGQWSCRTMERSRSRLRPATHFSSSRARCTPIGMRARLQNCCLPNSSLWMRDSAALLSWSSKLTQSPGRCVSSSLSVILQVGVRGGDARPGHGHHPTIDFDPVPVGVKKVEGMTPAAADEPLLASLGRVHVGTTDDLDIARAHVLDRPEPVLARINLEGDVIEARGCADTGVGRRDACLPHVRRKLEQDHIVVLVIDAHEANGSPEVGRTPTPRYLEPQHLAIKVDGPIDVADMDANVPDPAQMNAHALLLI